MFYPEIIISHFRTPMRIRGIFVFICIDVIPEIIAIYKFCGSSIIRSFIQIKSLNTITSASFTQSKIYWRHTICFYILSIRICCLSSAIRIGMHNQRVLEIYFSILGINKNFGSIHWFICINVKNIRKPKRMIYRLKISIYWYYF